MRLVVLDFETLFGDDFTLSKMTTEAYIRDLRFEAHGAAVKWSPDTPAVWYDAPLLRQWLAKEDWSDVFLICHHAAFDGLILNHHYGVRPKFWGDTLSMARYALGNHLPARLDDVRQHFGMPIKRTPYNLFKGKKWGELSPATQKLVADGAVDEVESIWKIFSILVQQIPREELEVIDTTIRMFTEPCLRADVPLLGEIWQRENKRKIEMMESLGVTSEELQSADKFAALLRNSGVEPGTKPSPKDPDNKQIYAFAKTDQFMRDLLENEDTYVQALAMARLGVKSTAVQTRAETLGFMAQRGPLCVYLNMYGAHTRRWSGADGSNFQNFKRSDPDGPKQIRDAILPPEGFIMLDPDLSQVECRILSLLAGQEDAVQEFRDGKDPYLHMATAVYGYEVTKAMKKERGTGKQLKLSAGYMAGDLTIQRTARLGIYGPPVVITLDEARRWKDIYRGESPMIVDYWATAGRMIARLAGGPELEWGPFTIKDKRLYLTTNKLYINYETLEYHVDKDTGEGNWRFKTRRGWSKLYSGKLVENIVQFAARVVASQAMIRIRQHGYRVVNTEHDKHWVLVPKDGNEARHAEVIRAEMVRDVPWLPGLPIECECDLPEGY